MSSEEFVESGDALGDSAVYEDEEFDEYSDSFKASSGGDASSGDDNDIGAVFRATESAPKLPVALHDFKNACRFESGDLVQVYWAEEREWFNGCVAQVDTLSGRCFVQYDDGEKAWETGERMRYAPEAFSLSSEAFQQLQLTLHNTTQPAALRRLLGAKVLIYWRESSSWFPGSIVHVNQENGRALQVEYDDGDLRWESEGDFLNILVLIEPTMTPETSASQAKAHSSPSHIAAADVAPGTDNADVTERVLIPRAYKAAVAHHFQPERTPRPYIPVANTIGSVLTARRGKYGERCYLHNAKLECSVYTNQQSTDDEILSRDCLVQTDIVGGTSTDHSDDRSHYSQCC